MSFRLLRTAFFVSFLLVCSFGVAFLSLGAQESSEDYWSLLAQLKSGDTSIDFTRLRMLFTKLPEYNPYRDMLELRKKENAMWKAYKEGKLEEAIQLGSEILERDYLRSMTHFIFSRIYEQLNDTAKQKFHDEVAYGLVRSVAKSGDGKTPETAMTVISIEEEYNVLDVLGFEQKSQELVEKGGKAFDHLQAHNPETDETRDFWFDISLFYGLATQEEPVSAEETGPPATPQTEVVTPTPSVEPTPQVAIVTTPPTSQVTPAPQSVPTPLPQSLTINPPPGWIPQTPEDPAQIGYYQLANNQGIVIAEYIVMRENLPSPMDLRGYLGFVQKDRLNSSALPGYTPQETTETILANLPSLRHDFLFTSDSQQLKGRVFFVILGNQAYSFLFYSTVSDFPNLEATFTQALASIAAQSGSAAEPGLPGIQPQPAGNLYQDPGGVFELVLPDGTAKKGDLANGVVFRSPNNGEIYLMKFASEGEAENTVQGVTGGKDFQTETSLDAGGKTARVRIYTFAQGGTNYAMLVSTYPGTPVLVIIVVPLSEYQASQKWMVATITGVRFR